MSSRYFLLLSFTIAAYSQTYTVQTIAGAGSAGILGGGLSGDGGPATSAQLRSP